MESNLLVSLKLLAFLSALALAFPSLPALSTNFAVGGNGNWTIPSSKDPDFYNEWASQNRFKVEDTVNFDYKQKDSVLVVTESEYNKCRSTRPIFFSNNGKTRFKFERAGLFYFISGVDGHCERGERMIVKVIAVSNASSPEGKNGGDSTQSAVGTLSSCLVPVFFLTVGNLAMLV